MAKSKLAKGLARFAKEMADKEKAGKAAAAKRVQKAGQAVGAAKGKAAVKRSARADKRAVSDNTRGMKKVSDLSKMDQLELAFDKLTKTAQRAVISKQRKGEPNKYSEMLELRKGIERVGKTAEKKARQAKAVEDLAKKMGKKASGGKMVKKAAGGIAAAAAQKMAENKRERDAMAKLGTKTLKYGGGTKKKTVKRKQGGSMKPKGVGCAMRGYGGAMKKK